jgi:hypothetical protein
LIDRRRRLCLDFEAALIFEANEPECVVAERAIFRGIAGLA